MDNKRILKLLFFSLIISFLIACDQQAPIDNISKNSSGTTALSFISSNDETGFIMRSTVGARISGTDSTIGTLAIHAGLKPNHVRGARIYDDFTIELASDASVTTPAEMNPLLSIATFSNKYPGRAAPTTSDSWRCTQCHDFDYEGGIYTFNRGITNNLLELMEVRNRTEEDVYKILTKGFMVFDGTNAVDVHNYTGILTEQAIIDVADFVINEIFDTHEYLMATGGASTALSMADGMALYSSVLTGTPENPPFAIRVDGLGFNCEECHGLNGTLATYPDGTPMSLFDVAWATPFKFQHRMLFGSPRDLSLFPNVTRDPTIMPGLYEVLITDGLFMAGLKEGSEMMLHIQSDMFPIQ